MYFEFNFKLVACSVLGALVLGYPVDEDQYLGVISKSEMMSTFTMRSSFCFLKVCFLLCKPYYLRKRCPKYP